MNDERCDDMTRGFRMGRLYLAGDSGGTKTDWLVFDDAGDVHYRHRTSGLARLHPGTLSYDSLREELSFLGDLSVCRAYLSLGGPNVDEVVGLLQLALRCCPVELERESTGNMILLSGGLLGCRAAVMVGTGSVAMGDVGGKRVYAGGWGPVYGDEGAGGGLGFRILHRFLRSIDGMSEAGRLGELFVDILSGLDIGTFAGRMELKRRANALERHQLAGLAPGLMELYRGGDAVACELLEDAARENAMLARAVTCADDCCGVLGIGGLFQLGIEFRELCEAALSGFRPNHHWVWCPEFSPVKAAMIKMLHEAGHGIKMTKDQEFEIVS